MKQRASVSVLALVIVISGIVATCRVAWSAERVVSFAEGGFGVTLITAVNNLGDMAGAALPDGQATLRKGNGQVIKLGVRGDVNAMTGQSGL
jgi:hypothetical protein